MRMKKLVGIPKLLVEVKPSVMLPGEIGLFAASNIRKEVVIAAGDRFEEIFHEWPVYKKLGGNLKKKIKQYCIQTPEGFYSPPDFNWLPATWNMNHSCDYNVGLGKNEDFVAARNIKQGEELCWDYGLGMSDPSFKLKCDCRSKNCRNLITGNDWKIEEYRTVNLKYFSRALLKRAEADIKKK